MSSNRRLRGIASVMLALAMALGGQALGWRSTGVLAEGQATVAESSVREALQRYAAALESRDADAVKKVQPSIAADTLAKAFRDMRELKVVIDAVRVLSIDGAAARVSCTVTQTLTPRVGSKQTTVVVRVVRMRREADAWVIGSFER